MRKITFNEETIADMKKFAETHTFMESCNRFTLKPDVMRRIAKENDIQFIRQSKPVELPQETVDLICDLYANTDLTIDAIRSQVCIRTSKLMDVVKQYFSDDYIKNRKSKMYSLSKQGKKNPMLGKCREQHPRYKGEVSDGKGYLMCVKPEWYTGRTGCTHVYVHTLVVCEALGLTELPKGYVVHHIDFDKTNNDINNLALMTISAHGKLHSMFRG